MYNRLWDALGSSGIRFLAAHIGGLSAPFDAGLPRNEHRAGAMLSILKADCCADMAAATDFVSLELSVRGHISEWEAMQFSAEALTN